MNLSQEFIAFTAFTYCFIVFIVTKTPLSQHSLFGKPKYKPPQLVGTEKSMTARDVLGLGLYITFGADFFVFWASSFQRDGMFKPILCADFWCADFGCTDFGCADFSSPFWRLQNNLLKNLRRRNVLAWVGTLFHLRFVEQTARHTIHTRLTTQGQRLGVHRALFGPEGTLAFAPGFFKNKICEEFALRTISLAWPPLQSLAVKKTFFCANFGR